MGTTSKSLFHKTSPSAHRLQEAGQSWTTSVSGACLGCLQYASILQTTSHTRRASGGGVARLRKLTTVSACHSPKLMCCPMCNMALY